MSKVRKTLDTTGALPRFPRGARASVRPKGRKQAARADAIKIGTQEKALTLFGLLSSDQDDDRRVYVTHD